MTKYKFINPEAVRKTTPALTTKHKGLVETSGFYSTEEDTDKTRHHVGLEIEQGFRPGTNCLRELDEYLGKKKDLGTSSYGIMSTMLRHVRAKVFDNCSQLLYSQPHYDGGGIECVLKPCTLSASTMLKDEFMYILGLYRSFGFSEIPGGDGRNAH